MAALVYAIGIDAAALEDGHAGYKDQCRKEPAYLSCPSPSPLTTNSCCSETFGGLLLTTQFWSTYTGLESSGQFLPSLSPSDDSPIWTIHGLWPDFCNGTWTQYCDLARQYDPHPSPNTTTGTPDGVPVPPYEGPDIGTLVEKTGRRGRELVRYMRAYWPSRDEPSHVLWAHEFSKHATCFSTFNTSCYGSRGTEKKPYEDVIDYFTTTISLNRRAPTGSWLARASILPSNTTTYTLSDIQTSLSTHHGGLPYLGCSGPRYNTTDAGKGSQDNGFTVLSEVWYYSHFYGRPQEGRTVPVDATGGGSNCARAKGAVRYLERTRGSERRAGVPF